MKKIPIYEVTIDNADEGIQCISLVKSPAVEINFITLSKEIKLAVEDEEKRIIITPIMRANFPIYRRDDNGEEYYIQYSKETIIKMAQKYMRENRQSEINIEHTDLFVNGVYLYESYIVDENKKAPSKLGKIEDGSWIGVFKVDNDKVWDEIKNGNFQGTSLEGYFGLKETKLSKQDLEEIELLKLIYEDLSHLV